MLHYLPLLLGLALCGTAGAAEPPRIDLTVTAPWKGWSRPGRTSEVDIRLAADAATAATVEVVAGRQSVRAEVSLQPGRVVRLHVPIGPADRALVKLRSAAGTSVERELRIAQSESPVLGVATVSAEPVRLEGFHTVALAADDLPRNAAGYASIDALILDAETLAAIDQRQLAALLGQASACGRIVVVNADPQVRRLLDGAGECRGGPALMSADNLTNALRELRASLSQTRLGPLAPDGMGELMAGDHAAWKRVTLVLAAGFAATALALMFTTRLPILLLTPAVVALAGWVLLQIGTPPAQLVVWSEGSSAAQLARYQAQHRVSGMTRERVRVQIPSQLAANAQPCDPKQDMQFGFDAKSGRTTFAEFDTRLFRQVSLCYSDSFPISRAVEIAAGPDGKRDVRNTGSRAWPRGFLLLDGRVHDLPALDPGAHKALTESGVRPPGDAAQRLAAVRTQSTKAAALWSLDLGGVTGIPSESRGWLLVTAPTP